MLIEDGQGTGFSAGVNTENRLKTIAITSSTEHHVNHEEGLAFNLILQQTPTYADPSADTGDVCICYIKNTDNTDMILEGIHYRLAGTGQSEIIKIEGKDTGTPIGGIAATPSNLNLGSGKTATGTFLTGDNITGLSGGTELERIYVGSSDDINSFNFDQDIIVPKNNIITIYTSQTGTEVDITLIFNYHSASSIG